MAIHWWLLLQSGPYQNFFFEPRQALPSPPILCFPLSPFPSLPFIPSPRSFLSLPSPALPLRSRPPHCGYGLAEHLSSPSGSAKRVLTDFRHTFEPVWMPENERFAIVYSPLKECFHDVFATCICFNQYKRASPGLKCGVDNILCSREGNTVM